MRYFSIFFIAAFIGFQPVGYSQVSKKNAMLSSLILPGTGEIKLNHTKRGIGFILSEIAFLSSAYGFYQWSEWRNEDAISYAAIHADIDLRGKDEQFFLWMAQYDNMDEFNEDREHYRDPENYLSAENGENWEWDKETSREQFYQYRASAKQLALWSRMAFGAVAANHIISAIDALYLHNTAFSAQVIPNSSEEFHIILSFNW